jgi:O-ureido-D-serine cyclo-ligase
LQRLETPSFVTLSSTSAPRASIKWTNNVSKPIALVPVDAAHDVDEDLPPLIRAFSAAGLSVETPSWDDASIDWSRYALALLRSTWNYTEKLPVFLDWCARTARQTLLLNPTDIVRWNTDKRYLADLESVGVAIIPSWFARDGETLTIRVVPQ